MRDPVPQAPNDLEVCIGRGPALRGRLTLRRAGKAGAEVRIPDAAVLADREDAFPEREFEFGYDFSVRAQGGCARLTIIRRVISELAFRTRQASRSEEHTSELQSLMRISYAVFCLKNKKHTTNQ